MVKVLPTVSAKIIHRQLRKVTMMNLNSTKHIEDIQLLHVERYLPEKIRTYIEENYYAKVQQQAELDYAARDENFLANPLQHIALYEVRF